MKRWGSVSRGFYPLTGRAATTRRCHRTSQCRGRGRGVEQLAAAPAQRNDV